MGSNVDRRTLLKQRLQRILSSIQYHINTISWVCYILGIVWVLLFPLVTISTFELKCRGTYISENALLVESADAKIDRHYTQRLYNNYIKSYNEYMATEDEDMEGNYSKQCMEWLSTQLEAMDRTEVYQHVVDPVSIRDIESTSSSVLYAILHASPLADGKESIVISAHLPENKNGSMHTVFWGLVLMEYLVQAKWLAKDVILLITESEKESSSHPLISGTTSWTHAYHANNPFQALPMHAGVIRAAINLELYEHTQAFSKDIGLFVAGNNGQLPNLDLVNTVVRALNAENLTPHIEDPCLQPSRNTLKCEDRLTVSIIRLMENYFQYNLPDIVQTYLRNLMNMLQFMKSVATGPSGSHAPFLAYNIDSLTIAIPQNEDSEYHFNLRLLRSLEKVVRSLSNIEEKLHQSFFFYLLPNTKTFVSIGEYYYSIVLLLMPAIVLVFQKANRVKSMRLAYGATAMIGAEVLGLLTLSLLWKFNTLSLPLCLAILTCLQVGYIWGILPQIEKNQLLTGCKNEIKWLKQMATYKNQDVGTTCTDTNGYEAMQFFQLILIIYSHCILGLLNYSMAYIGALVVIFMFVYIIPNWRLRRLWLALSSPLTMCMSIAWYDIDTIRYYTHQFHSHTNTLLIPYICCIYIPVHTLAMAINKSSLHTEDLSKPAQSQK